MAIKSAYITSSTRPNVRLYVEQTAKNTQYGTLNVTVQMNGAAIDAYNGPTINMSTVDASYVWTGSSGTISSSSWTNVYTKSGIIVWYTSASTRTITINTNGSYSWDRTEEGGDAGSELYAFGGDFEMSPKATPSSPTISAASSSVTLGSSVNITTANGTSGAMTATIGNHTETIMTVGNGTNAWSPTLATWGTYVTGSSAVATLRWNNVSTTITVAMPENSSTKPTISSIDTTAVNPLNGLYVQSRSKVTVNVTASGKYGATITAYSITVNGVTYTANGATSGVLNTSGTNTISVTVTDSRGFTSTSSTTITVQAYTAPTITSVNIFRSTSAKAADPSGTYITYNFYTTVASVSSNNAKKYGLQYRTQGSSSWTSTEGTLSAYTSTQTLIAHGSGNISTTTVYEARAYVKDSFQTVYSTIFTIPTASVIMDFNTAGTGGGIGMYTQAAGRLDVGWNLKVHGNIDSNNYPATGPMTWTSTANLSASDITLVNCTGTVVNVLFQVMIDTYNKIVCFSGRVRVSSYSRTSGGPGFVFSPPGMTGASVSNYPIGGNSANQNGINSTECLYVAMSGTDVTIKTTESAVNLTGTSATFIVPQTFIKYAT